MYVQLRAFIFPLIPFRESGSRPQLPPHVAGSFGCVPDPLYGLS
jgi:hypothetical protein